MPDDYPILEVKPEWVIESEAMGSKKKFWYRQPEEHQRKWLFKYTTADTGQHWAEKIAEQVASVLGIMHAKVELAQFQEERGSVTESFTRGGRSLYHGNQMLEVLVSGYSTEKNFRQSSHTMENIWKVIDFIFGKKATLAKRYIAEYIILDALIGNTDRHHENWGLLLKHWKLRVAPSFDHASSLGRELLDSRRDMLLAENRVGSYAERGRGAIYWSEDKKHGPSPLELVRLATRAYPDIFHSALLKIKKLDKNTIKNIVYFVPTDWMTPLARKFVIELMHYNLQQLKRLTQ